MQNYYLDQIRGFEGYTPKAEWDYAQFTNGYGTRARYAGEVISKAEAERRFKTEISEARAIVDKAAPHVDEGTKAALTSLTYNAGSSWVKSGLGDAVRAGDLERAREIFVQYNKAGGDVVDGLVNRRLAEVTWIGNPDATGATAGASAPVRASLASAADLPRVPITGATAVPVRAEVAQFVPATPERDPLGDLLRSVSRKSMSNAPPEQELKPQEAKIVASASDVLESTMVSDLALMAQTGTAGAGSVMSYYHGDVFRAEEQNPSKRASYSVTAA